MNCLEKYTLLWEGHGGFNDILQQLYLFNPLLGKKTDNKIYVYKIKKKLNHPSYNMMRMQNIAGRQCRSRLGSS